MNSIRASPHAVVRKERRLEGEIGITEVDHDLGVGSGKIADVAAIDVESHFAAIDPTAVALSTRRPLRPLHS